MERCFNSESVLVQFVDRHGDAAQSPEVAAAVRDKWLPYVATRLSTPLQRNRRPDRPMNKRAIRKLARLARRYENRRTTPLLKDVETTLWRAGEVADRRLGGYWSWGPVPLLPSDIEHWTSQNPGWSFPCAEGVSLIRRLIQWPCGRVIDIGAGRGLWTKVLKRVFGSDKVVGLPATLRRSTTPDDPSRLATDGAAGAAPRFDHPEGVVIGTLEAHCDASSPAVYASRRASPHAMQDSLPAGGLRLCRAGVEPAGQRRKVSDQLILLPRTSPGARSNLRDE